MATYVYKVNANQRVGSHYGDWRRFYEGDQPSTWGLVEIICRKNQPRPEPGDRIIAYQTNLAEVIGTANVVGYQLGKILLHADEGPFPRGVKVTELKKRDDRIGDLRAFQQGLIQTLYEIDDDDADHLLEAIKEP